MGEGGQKYKPLVKNKSWDVTRSVDLKKFSSQEKRFFLTVWRWMLTRPVEVIILQYVQMSNHNVVHLKPI